MGGEINAIAEMVVEVAEVKSQKERCNQPDE
jgi:hypothetical protein